MPQSKIDELNGCGSVDSEKDTPENVVITMEDGSVCLFEDDRTLAING